MDVKDEAVSESFGQASWFFGAVDRFKAWVSHLRQGLRDLWWLTNGM
jgi:hypothetical protein